MGKKLLGLVLATGVLVASCAPRVIVPNTDAGTPNGPVHYDGD